MTPTHLLDLAEKVHIVARRRFETDLRRHFVGEIVAINAQGIRVQGYAFVFDQAANQFVKRPEVRTRIFNWGGDGLIINVLPSAVQLEKVGYVVRSDKRLVVTDGEGFSLDINEFGAHR